MSKHHLKKEFQVRDVNRLRSLIKGEDNSTLQGVGYTKTKIDRKEGEVWEEDGKKYNIVKGLKKSISKFGEYKKTLKMPLFCPKCGKIMNNRFDSNYYSNHKKCFSCVVEFETELIRTGKFKEYQTEIHNDEIDNLKIEYENWFKNQVYEESNFITEEGKKENWEGEVDKVRALENLRENLEYLESLKK